MILSLPLTTKTISLLKIVTWMVSTWLFLYVSTLVLSVQIHTYKVIQKFFITFLSQQIVQTIDVLLVFCSTETCIFKYKNLAFTHFFWIRHLHIFFSFFVYFLINEKKGIYKICYFLHQKSNFWNILIIYLGKSHLYFPQAKESPIKLFLTPHFFTYSKFQPNTGYF